jgi:hypothetical protein
MRTGGGVDFRGDRTVARPGVKVRFLGRSAKHAESADHWWRDHRPAAPDLFARESEKALRVLARLPDIGVIYAQARRGRRPVVRVHERLQQN